MIVLSNLGYRYNTSIPTGGNIEYSSCSYPLTKPSEYATSNAENAAFNKSPRALLDRSDGRPFRWYIKGDITERPLF